MVATSANAWSSDEVLIAEVAEVGSEQIERSDRATSEPHR